MSLIGEFGLCKKASYVMLQDAVSHGSQKEFDEAVCKVQEEMERSLSILSNDECSGEAFIALFEYFNQCMEIDFRKAYGYGELAEAWRELTGDYDILFFTDGMMEEWIARMNPESMDDEALDQYVKEFYQCETVVLEPLLTRSFFII